jgi:hypothetical protein
MQQHENISSPAPPRLAEWLLEAVTARENQSVVIGDFSEQFLEVAHERGFADAKSWYWVEFFKSLPSLLQQHKLETVMTNKLIFPSAIGVGILLHFFVLAAMPKGTVFNNLYEGGPGIGVMLGLLLATIALVVRGTVQKPTNVIEYEKLLNTLNTMSVVSIIGGAIFMCIGLQRLFLQVAYITGVAAQPLEIDKFSAAAAEALWNPIIGLLIAVIAKIAYHVFKGMIISAKA